MEEVHADVGQDPQRGFVDCLEVVAGDGPNRVEGHHRLSVRPLAGTARDVAPPVPPSSPRSPGGPARPGVIT